MITTEPSIAVIICTRDRPADLVQCLKSIQQQSVQPHEVVVVAGSKDSFPTDSRCMFADMPIKAVDCYEHNISKSRNYGMGAAQSDLLLFIDDDAVAHNDWIRAYKRAFENNPDAWAVGGDVFDIRDSPPTIEFSKGRVSVYGRQIPVCAQPSNKKSALFLPNVKGCNFGIRKEQAVQAGGFDPYFAFAFDESDLMLTLQSQGGLLIHEPSAIVDHAHTPGHYRKSHPLDRDWRVEYASHTMFMLKHAPKSKRFKGRLTVRRRYLKLIAVVLSHVFMGSIRCSEGMRILRAANQGVQESNRVYASARS